MIEPETPGYWIPAKARQMDSPEIWETSVWSRSPVGFMLLSASSPILDEEADTVYAWIGADDEWFLNVKREFFVEYMEDQYVTAEMAAAEPFVL